MAKHQITRDDIMDMDAYRAERAARKSAIAALKKNRRLAVGPDVTVYFENYDTMWQQIHEMLHIEKGGAEQIAEELAAYNPLVPNGHELVVTMMVEIDEPARRARILAGLGGFENTVALRLGGDVIPAQPETDVERTTPDGKASSVQFLRFPMTPAQIETFRGGEVEIMLAIGHDNYGHMALLPEAVRAALCADFD